MSGPFGRQPALERWVRFTPIRAHASDVYHRASGIVLASEATRAVCGDTLGRGAGLEVIFFAHALRRADGVPFLPCLRCEAIYEAAKRPRVAQRAPHCLVSDPPNVFGRIRRWWTLNGPRRALRAGMVLCAECAVVIPLDAAMQVGDDWFHDGDEPSHHSAPNLADLFSKPLEY